LIAMAMSFLRCLTERLLKLPPFLAQAEVMGAPNADSPGPGPQSNRLVQSAAYLEYHVAQYGDLLHPLLRLLHSPSKPKSTPPHHCLEQ
jgi:hypothetical protein